MLLIATLTAALAGSIPQVDLDGDGTVDPVTVSEEGVSIDGHRVPCGGMELCSVELADVSSADSYKELVLTELGPRDDKSAWLYRLTSAGLVELSFRKAGDSDDWQSRPGEVVTSGSGIVLADSDHRIYTRREKYLASGNSLQHVPQPFWVVDYAMHVDRTFPIVRSEGSSQVVANVAPDSDIRILLESATQPGWFLVHISSGLTGWATLDTLMSGSNQLMGLMSAG